MNIIFTENRLEISDLGKSKENLCLVKPSLHKEGEKIPDGCILFTLEQKDIADIVAEELKIIEIDKISDGVNEETSIRTELKLGVPIVYEETVPPLPHPYFSIKK